MRSKMVKGLLATGLGLALAAGGFLARPAIAQDDLPDGPGKDVLMTACNNCHGVAQVTGEHQSAEQWASTVTMMINNGANVPDSQFDTLVAYLAANFGIAGQAPAPAASAPSPAPAPMPETTPPAPAPAPSAAPQ